MNSQQSSSHYISGMTSQMGQWSLQISHLINIISADSMKTQKIHPPYHRWGRHKVTSFRERALKNRHHNAENSGLYLDGVHPFKVVLIHPIWRSQPGTPKVSLNKMVFDWGNKSCFQSWFLYSAIDTRLKRLCFSEKMIREWDSTHYLLCVKLRYLFSSCYHSTLLSLLSVQCAYSKAST